ncbi:MAG: leucine-rich repeat protein [Methanobrevibacter sp.]|nr:leucine-rich repeat protein [Methanobrevibacter sp.]
MAFNIDNSLQKFILPEGEVKSIFVDSTKMGWAPLLDAPTIALSGDLLSITTPSSYATSYRILVNGVDQAGFSTLTYDIASLTYRLGNNIITTEAAAEDHRNSSPSNAVSITAYSVLYDILDGSANGTNVVIKGQGGQGVVTPDEDFLLPQTIEITGATLTYYNDETGEFTFSNATGDVEVYAECTPMAYSIEVFLSNSIPDANNPIEIKPDEEATLVFYFDGSTYGCPLDVLVSGAQYSWAKDSNTQGTLILFNAIAPIQVSVSGVAIYQISVSTINCTPDANNPTTINGDSGEALVFYFDGTSYRCPTSIIVSGNVSYTWTKNSDTQGTLLLTSARGNVSISIEGVVIVYQIIVNVGNSEASPSNPTTMFGWETKTLTYTFDGEVFVCPDSVAVTGATGTWTKDSDTQGTMVLTSPTNNISYNVYGYCEPYITITATGSIQNEITSLATSNRTKNWNGTIEYSTNKKQWQTWDGKQLSLSTKNLYIRGRNNTYITGSLTSSYRWSLNTQLGNSYVTSSGNIENLLDYTVLANGGRPTMGAYCFAYLFSYVRFHSAPQLPSTTLSSGCYAYMFSNNDKLEVTPKLPATTLANECYYSMFQDCTSLTTVLELPAVTSPYGCYRSMFSGCTSLVNAPKLPATTLADYCYYSMFQGCTALVTPPALNAMGLGSRCYMRMFSGCTSLTTAPALPALSLRNECYEQMFAGCTSLVFAPALPTTTLSYYCYAYMFQNCTSLVTIPLVPATLLYQSCYNSMFSGCTSLKVSEVMTDEYTISYRIPSSGSIAPQGSAALDDMFLSTGGPFTGTPTINTTYYLHYANTVVPTDSYIIHPVLSNATPSSSNPTSITKGETKTLVFTFDGVNNICPSDGPTNFIGADYTWTKNSDTQGTLIISNPILNVSFELSAIT